MDPTDMMAGALAGGAPPGGAPPPGMPGMPPNPQMAPNGAGGPMGMMGSPKMSPFGGLLSPMGGNLLQQLTQGGGPNSILKLLQNAQPQTTPGSTPSPVNPGQMPQGMQQ